MTSGSAHPPTSLMPAGTRHQTLTGAWRMPGFRLLDVGHHQRKDWRTIAPHGRTLTSYGLFLIAGGHGRWTTHRGAGALGAGSALLVRPGEWHCFDPEPGAWLEESWALFDGPVAERLVADFAGPRNHWHLPDPAAQRARCAAIFAAAGLGTASGACRAAAHLLAVLTDCITGGSLGPAHDPVDRWLAMAAARPQEATAPIAEFLATEDLGAEAFRKRCQRRCGRGPARLWAEARLRHARHLLTGTALPIGEIGRSLGFDDPARFAQWFRRLAGTSPSGARRP